MLDRLILMRSTLNTAIGREIFQSSFSAGDQQIFRLVRSIIKSKSFWKAAKRLARVLRPVCRLMRWYDSLATGKAVPFTWNVKVPAHWVIWLQALCWVHGCHPKELCQLIIANSRFISIIVTAFRTP